MRSPKLRLSGSEELNHQTTEHWEKNQLLDVFGRIPKHIRVLELSTGSMNASKTRQCKERGRRRIETGPFELPCTTSTVGNDVNSFSTKPTPGETTGYGWLDWGCTYDVGHRWCPYCGATNEMYLSSGSAGEWNERHATYTYIGPARWAMQLFRWWRTSVL